jgi:hypothetical protein
MLESPPSETQPEPTHRTRGPDVKLATALQKQFERFDSAHPDIWTLFVELTNELIASGKKHYSAYAIMHRIRWHFDTTAEAADSHPSKISNNWIPCYARKWVEAFPEHADFFTIHIAKLLGEQVPMAV